MGKIEYLDSIIRENVSKIKKKQKNIETETKTRSCRKTEKKKQERQEHPPGIKDQTVTRSEIHNLFVRLRLLDIS